MRDLADVEAFLTDIERLNLVYRKACVGDLSPRENSAEHSWHMALGLLTLVQELDLDIDLNKALVSFRRLNALAGLLLVPYLAWVTLAAALTLGVWRLNPGTL